MDNIYPDFSKMNVNTVANFGYKNGVLKEHLTKDYVEEYEDFIEGIINTQKTITGQSAFNHLLKILKETIENEPTKKVIFQAKD